VEAAIDLAGIVAHVTVIQYDEHLTADKVIVDKLNSLPNVTVITHASTNEINGVDGKVSGLTYTDRATGESNHIDLDAVFIQIGLVPNTDWLEETIDLSQYGEIEVDAYGMTSLPGVFAAGDVTTIPYKQIIMAMGDGAKAALGAFDYIIRNKFGESEAA
jgi:alkyl hydroperoxide reductase subunit F